MNKPQSIKVLLGVLVLFCAPAVAQVALGVAGAEVSDGGSFVVMPGWGIELRAVANAGDTVAVLAAPMDKHGQPDYSAVVLLLLDVDSPTGAVSGQFEIPKEVAGTSFQIIAAARDVDGAISIDAATMIVRAN